MHKIPYAKKKMHFSGSLTCPVLVSKSNLNSVSPAELESLLVPLSTLLAVALNTSALQRVLHLIGIYETALAGNTFVF